MRIRVRYSKLGKVRFTSHRDLARVWERAIRRAGLPVAYTEGFSPHPKLHFGLALSTGHESVAEYLDIDVRDDDAPHLEGIHALAGPLSACLPVGVDVQGVAVVPPGTGSLQDCVTSSTWSIEATGTTPGAAQGARERLLAAAELPLERQRKGKASVDDVRPYVLALDVVGPTERGVALSAELGTKPRGLRPAELLQLIDPACRELLVRRTHQWIDADGAREEPLPLPAAAPWARAHEARAS